jgi:RNA polymerase sigma factor (sigma-70 family)
MASGPMREIVNHVHRLAVSLDPEVATDGQLLEGFIARGDEAAFAALVRRHGPMVLGVCRRVVGDPHDAEDAFQATFFVLARKADDIRPRDMVGNWLYGVAYRTALKARTVRQRRRAVEKQVQNMPHPAIVEQEVWNDIQPLLDQELTKLPDVYRTPVVLCDVEGRARKDVARQLGVPEGTLSSRLARGRQMLARRLGRRGVTLSAVALGVVLAQNAASAAVPATLAASTAKTGALLAIGAGVIPTSVAALMSATFKTLLFNKVTSALSLVVAAAVGTGMLFTRAPAPPAGSPPQTAEVRTAAVAAPTDEERLQGTWDVVALETEGRAVPLPPELREQAVTFRADTVHTRFTMYEDGTVPPATFRLGYAREPRTIDVLVEGSFHSSGIYQLENDLLRICLAPAGRERPTEFKTTPEGPAVLFVLKPAPARG